jgi:hypothetical protein
MGKQMNGYPYGIFFWVWFFVACMIGHFIGVRFEGTGHGKEITYIIIFLLVIYPAVKYFIYFMPAEEEKSTLKHLHCLIDQGKYDKAKRFLKWNQFRIRDQDWVSELEERLDVLSQQDPAQGAEGKAQQGTMATELKGIMTDVLDVLSQDVLSQQIPAQRAEAKAQQGTMATVLKVLAYIWFGLFGTLLVISGISLVLKEGFWTFAQGWSPFSILSLLFVFSPGIAALLLAKWLEKRKSPRKP